MTYKFTLKTLILYPLFSLILNSAFAQTFLPTVMEWNGKSESLIVKSDDPWITPTERSDFKNTPDYDETVEWLEKLCSESPLLSMLSIGESVEGRSIYMIIASKEKNISASSIKNSEKATLLVQAGIHAGEIDGKDAGMMLLRDIAFGSKGDLLDKTNLLFIPILNVDGHERSSAFNRPNQRGPENMGWRTNAKNLNLNRDYTKLDTEEIRAVVKVINEYKPTLYMDIHVTDGADYQYDITFGGLGSQGYSPALSQWLGSTYKPYADNALINKGHIPGQLLFALNNRDFTDGNVLIFLDPRFSDSYGNLRHLASVLVENHSLKPYKQRVLGTYVLVESTLRLLAVDGQTLKELTKIDEAQREAKIPTAFKVAQIKNEISFESLEKVELSENSLGLDSILLLGIKSKMMQSSVTNSEYVEWLAIPEEMMIANYLGSEGINFITRPKGYWVPVYCDEVIERLKIHGIEMEIIGEDREVEVEMYRIEDAHFGSSPNRVLPYEGHMRVSAKTRSEMRKEVFPAGSVYISTDQTLGDLTMILLEPESKDSFFSWGFFLTIFQRTEYIEGYVIEPMAKKMLEESPELQIEFDQKMEEDEAFAKDPYAILTWFYSKTKYYDDRYLLYPVGKEW